MTIQPTPGDTHGPKEGFLDAYIFDPRAEPPADEPIFDGFLSKGDLTVWVGREKHRKSNLVLQCAMHAALGRDFLNFRFAAPGPLKVMMVDYESKNTKGKFCLRYEAICQAMHLTEEERLVLKANLRVILVREIYKAGGRFPRLPVRTTKENAEEERFWLQFADKYPADLYVFDPMRCLHAEGENDSTIELVLSRLRQFLPKAAIIIPHHMSKKNEMTVALTSDMRNWSDGARGSTAIKAHADVIVCQERTVEADTETVHLGAFMKDGADVEPIPLVESNPESFYWQASANVPPYLRGSFEALRQVNRPFRENVGAT